MSIATRYTATRASEWPDVIGSDLGFVTRQTPIANLLQKPLVLIRVVTLQQFHQLRQQVLYPPLAKDAPQIEMLAKRFNSGDKFSEPSGDKFTAPHYRSQIQRLPHF
ncbi:MAG: hypothetical protein JWN70_5770 [Planctomycetaceae bacterium]|nr:hypothetical protein [Planctomycetaceae bacterium]